jgi:DNA-binding CsgD family transcriptional regulator
MNTLAAELEGLGGADITAALEELPVRSFVIDRDGVVRWVSKSGLADVGDRVGERWTSLFDDANIRRIRETVERALKAGESAELTIEVKERDGRVHRRDVSIAPLRGGGSVLGLFGIAGPDRARPRTSEPVAGSDLTERQLAVLQLLAEGRSTSQIADELVVSTTTVRNHIAHVLARLGAHTRVQALIVASRAGLIRLPPPDEQ